MVRQGHLLAVVEAFLIGYAVVVVIGCAGVGSEAPREEQGHAQASKRQEHPEATKSRNRYPPQPRSYASEETREPHPQPIVRRPSTHMSLPGCSRPRQQPSQTGCTCR
jgi:hypothetical protein